MEEPKTINVYPFDEFTSKQKENVKALVQI